MVESKITCTGKFVNNYYLSVRSTEILYAKKMNLLIIVREQKYNFNIIVNTCQGWYILQIVRTNYNANTS